MTHVSITPVALARVSQNAQLRLTDDYQRNLGAFKKSLETKVKQRVLELKDDFQKRAPFHAEHTSRREYIICTWDGMKRERHTTFTIEGSITDEKPLTKKVAEKVCAHIEEVAERHREDGSPWVDRIACMRYGLYMKRKNFKVSLGLHHVKTGNRDVLIISW